MVFRNKKNQNLSSQENTLQFFQNLEVEYHTILIDENVVNTNDKIVSVGLDS